VSQDRASHPVGVKTVPVASAGREVPAEIWYPASAAFAGKDSDRASMDRYQIHPDSRARLRQAAVRDAEPEAGRFPLVIFSHGFSSHRRNATYLTCGLAAQGYVVAAAEHLGTSTEESIAAVGTGDAEFARVTEARVADISALVDVLPEHAPAVDAERAFAIGHSLGGHSALLAAAADSRIAGVMAMAPSGGADGHEGERLGAYLQAAMDKVAAPVVFVLASDDSFVPSPGIGELFELLTSDKRLVEIANTDHMIFVDQCRRSHELARKLPVAALRVNAPFKEPRPFAELLPEEDSYWAVRSLAHAAVRGALDGEGLAAVDALTETGTKRGVEFSIRAS